MCSSQVVGTVSPHSLVSRPTQLPSLAVISTCDISCMINFTRFPLLLHFFVHAQSLRRRLITTLIAGYTKLAQYLSLAEAELTVALHPLSHCYYSNRRRENLDTRVGDNHSV